MVLTPTNCNTRSEGVEETQTDRQREGGGGRKGRRDKHTDRKQTDEDRDKGREKLQDRNEERVGSGSQTHHSELRAISIPVLPNQTRVH